MIIFKKMFAEKILRFHEAMNRFSELLMRMPHLGDKIRNQIEENDNYRLKMTFGVIAQIGIVLFELLRKFLYVGFFVYLPYRIIAHFCPLIASHRELTMIFLFFMLSTICGSLANTTLMSMGDRDYLMIRINKPVHEFSRKDCIQDCDRFGLFYNYTYDIRYFIRT